MSMQFDPALDPVMQQHFKRFMEGEGIANVDQQDGRTALLSNLKPVERSMMKMLTRETGSTISLEVNSIGDTKTVGDVEYKYTVNGWIRQAIGGGSGS